MAISGHNGNNETLIGTSTFNGLSFYDESLNEIKIDTSQSIHILIQRDNQQTSYPFQYVNASQTNANFNTKYLQNSFSIKSMNSSIHLELKPVDTSKSYLIVLRLGSLPIINSTYAAYSSFKMLCPCNYI